MFLDPELQVMYFKLDKRIYDSNLKSLILKTTVLCIYGWLHIFCAFVQTNTIRMYPFPLLLFKLFIYFITFIQSSMMPTAHKFFSIQTPACSIKIYQIIEILKDVWKRIFVLVAQPAHRKMHSSRDWNWTWKITLTMRFDYQNFMQAKNLNF